MPIIADKDRNGRRIWVFSTDDRNSCGFQIRLAGPLSYLQEQDYDVVYAPSWKAVLKLSLAPDIAIFHRNAYPLREVRKIMRFAAKRRLTTIVEIDDLITHVPGQHVSYSRFENIKGAMIELFKRADFITVTNSRLREQYLKYNPNVYVLPNFIDERIWDKEMQPRPQNEGKVVIGYSGSDTHSYDFKVVIPAIKHIAQKYGDRVLFKFIGYIPQECKGLANVSHIEYMYSYREYAGVLKAGGFDFALAVLEDNMFNECKSNIKFLEYSICGYPGLYSRVGPYIDSVTEGETGILVDNKTGDWIRAMESMIDNPALRDRLGRRAFDCVRSRYSMKEGSKEWVNLFSGIIASGTDRRRGGFSARPFISYGCYIVFFQFRRVYYAVCGVLRKMLSKAAGI